MTGESRTGGQDTNRETQRERRDRPETAGCAHERQVLVVGEDPPAIATAGFLSQVGLNPVLARPPSERAGPNTLTLWRPGLVLLERLGLRRPVEAIGTRLDRLARPNVNSSWTTDQSDRPALLSVRRAELLSLLDRRVRDRIRTPERPIVDIDRSQDRVDATFEGGIEESFDTVVTTDSTLAPTVEPRHVVATTHTWAFDWPTEPSAPDGPTERWKGDRAAFSVPVADGTRVRLVSVTDPTCAATDVDSLERQFGASGGQRTPSRHSHSTGFSITRAHEPSRYRFTPMESSSLRRRRVSLFQGGVCERRSESRMRGYSPTRSRTAHGTVTTPSTSTSNDVAEGSENSISVQRPPLRQCNPR